MFGREAKTIPLAALHPDAYRAITEDKSLVVVHTATELEEAEAKKFLHHEADHVTRHLASVDTLTLQVSEDDAKRALALADIEADLQKREAAVGHQEVALRDAEADLQARVVEFDERVAGLVARENDLNERERQLDARQAVIDAAEKSAAGAKTSHQGRKS
ncbi:hypothetical protein C6Q04_29815 [Burkholderia multivorans]|nr:hypothetical protein C6Q04_29815 [Burkholderia multivorans]PRG50772.1 hypothetical protein C6T63_17720 [Burkholderia multivorans]